MYKNENLDPMLKSYLTQNSSSLFVTPKMFEKIISRLEDKKNQRHITFILSKKVIPVAICCALILGLIFATSPQSKVWAAEGINKIYQLIKGENGYKVEAYDVLRTINGSDYVINEVVTENTIDTQIVRNTVPNLKGTKLTGEKLNEYLGYKVKLPHLLENGFELKNKSVIKDENISLLLAEYENNYKIFIVTSNQKISTSSENRSVIKVGNTDGEWFESPIAFNSDGKVIFDSTQKPEVVKTSNNLSWEDNGVYYALMDAGNDMSIENVVALAEFIMASN